VFPIFEPNGSGCTCPNASHCDRPGKHPRTRNGFKDATADAGQIDAWWLESPNANIGVATGTESGVVVLDVDGDKGRASFATLPTIPNTWRSRTGRGEHVWTAKRLRDARHPSCLTSMTSGHGKRGYLLQEHNDDRSDCSRRCDSVSGPALDAISRSYLTPRGVTGR